jgi:LmbE family N-acetylglucosaminyl deacetylase
MGGAEVREVFEDLKGSVAPDLVIVPRRDDTHQDHRMVAELTWNTFRDYLVLE